MRRTAPALSAARPDSSYSVRVAGRANHAVLGLGVAVLVVLAVSPFFAGRQVTAGMIGFFIYLTVAELWNLMLGYAGLISVGQQGFIGIGAYILWFFADIVHLSPWAAIVLAGVGGMIIALPAAALVFRLKGGYLAIGTWVIAEVIRLIMTNVQRAGGAGGIDITATADVVKSVGIDGMYARVYWWALAAAVAAIMVTYLLLRSRAGLGLKAMRDNDLAAESSGVNLWRSKLYTYVIAGAGCAMAGAILAMNNMRVDPSGNFDISWTAYMIFISIIGGVGTIEGPIIGSVIFYVLWKTIGDLGTWYFVILGVVAIAVTIWSPQGIYGWIAKKTGFMLFPLQRKLYFVESESSPVRFGWKRPRGRA
jgi:branched-chain amino acid transport system permease protein